MMDYAQARWIVGAIAQTALQVSIHRRGYCAFSVAGRDMATGDAFEVFDYSEWVAAHPDLDSEYRASQLAEAEAARQDTEGHAELVRRTLQLREDAEAARWTEPPETSQAYAMQYGDEED